jgi:D-aspartate ligase
MVLLACNDEALELIAREREAIVAHGHVTLDADQDVVLRLLDKHRTYEGAREIGIAVPRTVLVRAGDDPIAVASAMGFPVALKPRHSHRLARDASISLKVFLATNERELVEHGARVRELGLDMLVTEVIPGAEDAYHSYYTYVGDDGLPVVEATKHKLRQFPVGFGLATLHVTSWNEEVIALGRRFCAGFGVRGLACVEFKRDSRDGELKLIECNSRFTAGNELIRHAGVDLARLAYNRAVGLPDPRQGDFRPGLHMWHPVEDMRAFLVSRRDGLTIRTWLRSISRRQHFPLFSLGDPGPTIANVGRLPSRWLARRLVTGAPSAAPEAEAPSGS